jgi:hypothetical protein
MIFLKKRESSSQEIYLDAQMEDLSSEDDMLGFIAGKDY